MTSLDTTLARKFAENAAHELGDLLRSGHGNPGEFRKKEESASSVVTRFDEEADHALFESLASFDASIGYFGEEHGQRGDGSQSTYWLVDPIDGTGLYVRGLPGCTCMISLVHDNEPIVAVIYDFAKDDMYSASKGGGATRNGEAIHVSNRGLADGYVSVEINTKVEGNEALFTRILGATVPMANINCGWDFAMVASGRIDGRVTKDPWGQLWDYTPGTLLVKEAGGVVANLGSREHDMFNFNLIASSPQVFEDLTSGPDAIFPI